MRIKVVNKMRGIYIVAVDMIEEVTKGVVEEKGSKMKSSMFPPFST